MVVCENEMKFDAVEPNQGSFSFNDGDRLVNFANRHNMRVRGHTLAWHSQVPTWLTSDGTKNTNNFSRKQLLDILHNHIKNVVTHWKGKVAEWDVANEVLSDNQQTIYSNPNGYDLRPSVWATGIGEDFLDSAFVWAHKYDPDAVLILNDYGVENKGWGKSEALYNLAMRLRNSGIPIHGVGLQAHMDAGNVSAKAIDANITRFKDAGFEYTGRLQVLKTILGYDYLWNNIRVLGGAYGCMSGFSRNGDSYLASYRDPNLEKTIEVFEGVPEYIEKRHSR